ncbi:MAG: response regulator [Chloroflexota bacterium]
MKGTTVAITDDQTSVRQGIQTMLEAETDLVVVGEASSGLETLRLVDEVRPEVLVLDLVLGDINGFEVTSRLREKWPETKVVIFSMHWDGKHVLRAQQVGASAYVPKKTPYELVKAIHEVSAGREYFPGHTESPPEN